MVWAAVWLASAAVCAAGGDDDRFRSDAARLVALDPLVDQTLTEIETSDALWRKRNRAPLTLDERGAVQRLFAAVFDEVRTLESISRYHFGREGDRKLPVAQIAHHHAIGYAAYAKNIHVALAFVEHTAGVDQFEKLLDEGSPEFLVPSGAYADLKWNSVHLLDVIRLFTGLRTYRRYNPTLAPVFAEDPPLATVCRGVECDVLAAQSLLQHQGPGMFATNGMDILGDGTKEGTLPIQAGISEWAGDTRTIRNDRALVSLEQAREAIQKGKTGDIIVERRNWFISNIALPGFWPHSAIWVGSVPEMSAMLDADAETLKAYGRPFTQRLREEFPAAWAAYAEPDEKGRACRVIEAVSEGVIFSAAEHTLACDYAAAMRPRLRPAEIARAIETAFSHFGKPYDFDFDFFTDRALVCSELVCKSYEPRAGFRGIPMELETVAGRQTLSPNTIVQRFDRDAGTTAQTLDFAWFLDGQEKTGTASFRDEATFRATHKRLKWDVAQP